MQSGSKLKVVLVILLIIIAGVVAAILAQNNSKKSEIELVTITESDAKYFVYMHDSKYGVIDKDGKVLVEPNYVSVEIPNPTTDIFICKSGENENSIALNSSNQQILTKFEDIEAIRIPLSSDYVPYEKSVLKYKSGDQYGITDFNGNILVDPLYEEINAISYKEGYLICKSEGKIGVLNIKGSKVIEPKYYSVNADGFYNEETKYERAGFIVIERTDDGYKYGYANSKGKIMVDAIYSNLNRITDLDNQNDVYLISLQNGKYGLIKNRQILMQNEYDNIDFNRSNKILLVEKDSKFGIYSIDGKEILPIEYDSIEIGGTYLNSFKNGNSVVYDLKGKQVTDGYISYSKCSEDTAIVIDSEGKYNIADNKGNKKLTETYAYIGYFTGDIFYVTDSTGMNSGVIKSDGTILIPVEYKAIAKDSNANVLITYDNTNNISVVSSEGKITKTMANARYTVYDNYIKLYSDNDFAYFDLNGNEKSYQEIVTDNTIYSYKENGKFGFKDASGNVVIAAKYDNVTEQKGNYVAVKIKDKWGVLNVNGNVELEPTYTIQWMEVEFIGKYYLKRDSNLANIYTDYVNQ